MITRNYRRKKKLHKLQCTPPYPCKQCVFSGPQLVRCGPTTVALAAPAPRPSLLSQFITCSSGQWPCLCSKQFQVPASLAGVRAVGLRFWALPPGDIAHMILSPGRGVNVVFHVWVAVTMAVLACAGPSWPHTLGFVVSPGHGVCVRGGGGGGCTSTKAPSK